MSNQQTASSRPSRWAVDLVERLGIEDEAGPHWENTLRVKAGRSKVDVRCPQGYLVGTYGLSPPAEKDDPEPGPIVLLKGRGARLRGHPTNRWLAMSRVVLECGRCPLSHQVTRLALQDAVEEAVASARTLVVLGHDV